MTKYTPQNPYNRYQRQFNTFQNNVDELQKAADKYGILHSTTVGNFMAVLDGFNIKVPEQARKGMAALLLSDTVCKKLLNSKGTADLLNKALDETGRQEIRDSLEPHKEKIGTTLGNLGTTAQNGISSAGEFIQKLVNGLQEAGIGKKVQQAKDTVKDVLSGNIDLVSQIQTHANKVNERVGDFVGNRR